MSTNVSSFPRGWKTEQEWYLDSEGKFEKDRRQMYSLSSFMYKGVHFGIVSVMHYPRDVSEGGFDTHQRHERDVVDVYWAISRNGVDWKLDWIHRNQPIIPRGDNGTWDKDLIIPSASIVTFKGRHWLYYMGCNERHEAQSALTSTIRANTDDVGHDVHRWRKRWQGVKKAIGTATTLTDRFMYFTSGLGSGVGWFVTKQLVPNGHALMINADATQQGSIYVEILDAIEQVTQAKSNIITDVDSVSIPVLFTSSARARNSQSQFDSKPIRLRFVLDRARLYAFSFVNISH